MILYFNLLYKIIMQTSYIIIWVVVVFVLFLIGKYNGLVRFRNTRDQSFADIDVQLKQRFNLIPNLVSTVEWYATHERETLEEVTRARTSFLWAGNDVNGKIAADNMLAGALKSIFAVAESYPDLKANENFIELQKELSDIENKIAASRRFFNSTTQEYNTYVQVFPNNVLAWFFGFKEADMYEIENEKERENIKVKF